MKRPHFILALVAAWVVAVCESGGAREATNLPASTSTAGPPKPSYRETAKQTKEQFVASMKKQLKEADARLAGLKQKSAGYKDDAKAKAQQTLAELREQRGKANEKFKEVKKKSVAAWEDVKAGAVSALDDLKKACEQVKAKFD